MGVVILLNNSANLYQNQTIQYPRKGINIETRPMLTEITKRV